MAERVLLLTLQALELLMPGAVLAGCIKALVGMALVVLAAEPLAQ